MGVRLDLHWCMNAWHNDGAGACSWRLAAMCKRLVVGIMTTKRPPFLICCAG